MLQFVWGTSQLMTVADRCRIMVGKPRAWGRTTDTFVLSRVFVCWLAAMKIIFEHCLGHPGSSDSAVVDLCLFSRGSSIVTIRCDCQCHVLGELCLLWPIIIACVGALATLFGMLGTDAS